jgi:predicted anti-sigma-YlaC factor YlaD
MRCDDIREAISAAADGEVSGLSAAVVDAHLRSCAACRGYAQRIADLQEVLRARQLSAPDLTSRILARAAADRDARLLTWPVRVGLVFVAAAQLVLAVPGLLFGNDDGAPVHIAHEMGSWDVALAVAFLFVAWRPLRAIGLLPFVAVLSACLVATAVIDLIHGRAVAVLEFSHILEVIGTVLLWLLTHPVARHDLSRRDQLRLA